jgi:5'-nucleotidase
VLEEGKIAVTPLSITNIFTYAPASINDLVEKVRREIRGL